MSEEKENIEELKKTLEECQKLKDEYLAGWQRMRADFLNYKKEENIRMEGMATLKNGLVALKIFPILDNLDIAEKRLPRGIKEDENIKGILQIKKQVLDLLKSLKITEIESLGKKFDPNLHEVVEEEAKEDTEKDTIIEELQKGYLFEGKVLRPAKVKISK